MSAIFNLFYIYDPWLFHFLRMAFLCGVLACVILIYRWAQKKLVDGIILPIDSLVVIIGLILFSIIPILLNATTEFAVIIQYVKTLILFIFGIAIYNLFYANESGQAKVIRDLKIGIVIQSIVGILALSGIPFVIDLSLSTNVLLPRFYGSEQEYRLYNITSMAFFQLSIFYLMLMHFLLAYNAKNNNVNSLFLFLLLFIGLISGRTFLFLSVLSILVYFKWRYIPVLIVFSGICLFLAINFSEHKYVLHALEPLINILKITGVSSSAEQAVVFNDISQISSSSENLVKNQLYLPKLKQILLGDGYYYTPAGHYYGATDSGFIRQILYGGIAYLAVCFFFTAYFVYRIAQNWFDTSWKFILSTILILSILNIKADTYAFPGIMLVLLMFLSLFGRNGKQVVIFKRGN